MVLNVKERNGVSEIHPRKLGEVVRNAEAGEKMFCDPPPTKFRVKRIPPPLVRGVVSHMPPTAHGPAAPGIGRGVTTVKWDRYDRNRTRNQDVPKKIPEVARVTVVPGYRRRNGRTGRRGR